MDSICSPEMPRRAFMALVSGGLLAAPLAAGAQQPRVYRVGVLLQGGPYLGAVDGLRKGLAELGLEEGKQFILHIREGRGDLKAVEQAAGDLEREKVDLIYSFATSVTLAVKRATKTVPIVFNVDSDPVAIGLVESFRKPGGRLTGIYRRSTELTAKRLELLKEMVPSVRRVVTFYNPDNRSAQRAVNFARDAARQLKVELVEHRVSSVEELRAGLRALRAGEADAYFSVSDAMVISQTALVIDTARAKKLPTIFQEQEIVANGGLASYGGESYYATGRLSAKYVQRILLGAEPGDLPVEQIDKLHFAINLKTAKALGLTIPPSLLQRADEVIQ
jgi:putative tryptophan/tyrosine transport system substrate-binding protein